MFTIDYYSHANNRFYKDPYYTVIMECDKLQDAIIYTVDEIKENNLKKSTVLIKDKSDQVVATVFAKEKSVYITIRIDDKEIKK